MSGAPRKGNFIHVYNASALDPEIETIATSGSETTSSLDSPRSLGSESGGAQRHGALRLDTDGNEDRLREGVARSRTRASDAGPCDSLARRPPRSGNLFTFVQRWYRQYACCCTADSGDVLGYTRTLNLNSYEEERLRCPAGELQYAPTPLDNVSNHDAGDTSRRVRRSPGGNDAISLCAKDSTRSRSDDEKEKSPANSMSTSAADATSAAETEDMPLDVQPDEVLPDIDALVSRIKAFMGLRRKFACAFADVRQNEGTGIGGFLVLDSIATPSSVNLSAITSSFRSFIRSCIWHFDADKVMPTEPACRTHRSATIDHTLPIVCDSLEEMDVLMHQILQCVKTTANVTLCGIANNIRAYVRYTHYPSIILTIRDARAKDDEDADGDNVHCVELHHATLYALQQEHLSLYQPFAMMARNAHVTVLDRLFTAEKEDCRAELDRMLRVQQQNLESLRGLRVLRALLAGEPDDGPLGEYVLARLVDIVDIVDMDEGTESAMSQQLHNTYARLLHRKAMRLSHEGKERVDEAERTFALALHAVRPQGCPVESPPIIHDIAVLHEERGQLDLAARLFARALGFADVNRPSTRLHAASSTDSPDDARFIDTAHRLALLLRRQGKVAECATLCSKWDLTMEDVERELRRNGKLPRIETASSGAIGRRPKSRMCLPCGVGRRP